MERKQNSKFDFRLPRWFCLRKKSRARVVPFFVPSSSSLTSEKSNFSMGSLFFFLLLLVLSGCALEEDKASLPLPEETQNELRSMGIPLGSPIFVRIFKQEKKLEVWLEKPNGPYVLFRSYPICAWSGKLGPKIREGDRQAPEGFYPVFPEQMNPNSRYYLSFNLGFPNAYDQFFSRTGRFLMVHGNCKSAGCYAIGDRAMQELYVLAREAFSHGQKFFQVQAFPFRMMQSNMTKSLSSPWFPFWENLREGYLFFERTRTPPSVGLLNGRYVFFSDQAPPGVVPLAPTFEVGE